MRSSKSTETGIVGVILRTIDWLDAILTALVKPAVFVLGLVIAVAFAGGVFFRTVIGTAVFGLEEIILLSVMWFYLLGAALASSERSHLSADFIPLIISNPKAVRAIALLATAISLFLAVLVFQWSLDLAQWGLSKGQSTPVFRIPWWVSQISLVVGSGLFILYLTRDFLHDLMALIRGVDLDEESREITNNEGNM